jgi:aerobic carbon-monoxide dehydrogenase small subunit
MRNITLTVNGEKITAQVEPRTHLADFLRDHLRLTGTHIGCEHGICGACTVTIDGEIGRACITYAVQCDGAEITTIEGFDDDPLMARLREAFNREHALQCGYCTPGMIIAARDLIRRKGQVDERFIREEMSGNLCRCTGYMGIVAAIESVMTGTPDSEPSPGTVAIIGPAPGPDAPLTPQTEPVETKKVPAKNRDKSPRTKSDVSLEDFSEEGLITLDQSFMVNHPPAEVWAFFGDLQTVARCLPGARLTGSDGDLIEGEMKVKLGPITPSFAGEGRISRDDRRRHARIVGHAKDSRSASRARGRIDYTLYETGDGGTKVEIEIGYALAGALAQFSRGAIAIDLVNRLTATFARNLEAAIGGDDADREQPAEVLDAGGLIGTVIWARVRAFFRKLLGRD